MAGSSTAGLEAERGTSGAEADIDNRLEGADTRTPVVAVGSRPPGAEEGYTAWVGGRYTPLVVWGHRSMTYALPADQTRPKANKRSAKLAHTFH